MKHALRQMVITIGAPPQIDGKEGRQVLADFYGELLGMEVVSTGWLRIAMSKEAPLSLALDGDGWSDQRPPKWPDPEFPQQIHLDIAVAGLGDAGDRATALGATLLKDNDHWRVYGDPAGHPFCLFENGRAIDAGRSVITSVTFDCFSPRSLATFYERLIGTDKRTDDEPDRVVIALEDDDYPDLAFQHAPVYNPPRWPDDAYPAQLHIDYRFVEGSAIAAERAERLGAIRLPKLADTEILADPAGHPFCL